ncbi:serine/arginine repetitive matrix protein 2-like isoform X1 [Amphibalanus amphitrite]|uniref:serine/arginine repetitive matrix protein 2-like isoform X1 n=1 Tax=Amphibalanus amphitrite TaxID=1232801 RepID=UPI001C912838|nr:serine/arginine repetitive matrix protein 2-like isoform X1 [Amphibalanus amphitrite]
MRSKPKPRSAARGRGRGRGAVVRYKAVAPQTGAGDSKQVVQKEAGGAVLHEYPLTPTPLPVRAQRQTRRSEAGFRPRIVELDPVTDRTLHPTPAQPPSSVGRRSSVQSRLSSVPSFSPGGVVTSTRLESPAVQAPRSSVSQFVKPRTPQKRRSDRPAAVDLPPTLTPTPTPPPPPTEQEQQQQEGGDTPQASGEPTANSWETPKTRRSATKSASSSASNNETPPTAQNTKISAKQVLSGNRSSAHGSSGRRDLGGSRAGSTPAVRGGRSTSRGRGRGAASRSRSRTDRDEESDKENEEEERDQESGESAAESEDAEQLEQTFNDSVDDPSFHPPDEPESGGSRGRRNNSRVAHSLTSATGRANGTAASRAAGANASKASKGRPSTAAAAPDKGKKSTRKSKDTTAAKSRRSTNHPALSAESPPARRGGRRSAGQRRSTALRCPLTVRVAGRTRTVAADNRADMLETAEDLVEAARSRPLHCYGDVGKFTWDLDQCVIDLMALKETGRYGAPKLLRAVKKNRTAVELLLNPVKVELVELYNKAYKEDADRRRDEAVRAFLYDDDSDE